MHFSFSLNQRQGNLIIGLLVLISIIFQLAANSFFEFHRDELLYFSLGQHLDFGYHSVPPLIGFLAFLSIKLFGYTLIASKVFPALAGGMLILLTSLIAKEIKGGIFAQILACVSVMVSILMVRASGLFQPVIFDILFWTLTVYYFIKYLNTNFQKYLIFIGVVVGIGFLNKYNMLFMVFALFISLLFTKYRKVYTSKYLYLAGLIAFIIVLPNLIWQVAHDLPVINHMNELRESQLVNMNPFTFLVEQLLMTYPATLLTVPGLIFLIFSKSIKEYRVLGFYSIAVLLIFLILSGKSYYSAGIYPMLIAVGAVFYESTFKNLYLRSILILLIVFLGSLSIPMGKPIYSTDKLVSYFDKMKRVTGNDNVRRDEDNNFNKLPQDYTDMLGWEELTAITNKAWQMIADKKCGFIYCENYGQAGAISIIGKKYNLPEPVSFSDNFFYWIPMSLDHEKTDFIYINDELGEDVEQLFTDIQIVGKISNPLAREYGTTVYLCRRPRVNFNDFWNARVRELINN